MSRSGQRSMLSLLREVTPPVLVRWASSLRRQPISFVPIDGRWDDAAARCSGYDDQTILERVLGATLEVEAGRAAFERDSVTFPEPEYNWPLLSCLLWSAARNDGRLEALDFGGSLGSVFWQHRRYLEGLREVRWKVVEQPHFVAAGRDHFDDSRLSFHQDIADARGHDVVLLSSVLQYLPDPGAVIADITAAGGRLLVIDRTPICELGRNLLCVQHVPAWIYEASYPMWAFDREWLSACLSDAWQPLCTLSSAEGTSYRAGSHRISFETWILERKS